MASNRFHAAPDPARLHRIAAECEQLGFELVPIDDALAAEAARMGYTVRPIDRLAASQKLATLDSSAPLPTHSPHPSPSETVSALRREKRLVSAHPPQVPPTTVPLLSAMLGDHQPIPTVDPTLKTEPQMQQFLCDLMPLINNHAQTVSVLAAESSPRASLSRPHHVLKPDGPIYHRSSLKTEDGMVAVIEVKAYGAPLTDDPSAQLFNYLEAILYHQPARTTVFGALWNGTEVQLYEATRIARNNSRAKFTRWCSCDFKSDDGQRVFPFLMCSPHAVLGFEQLTVTLPGAGKVALRAANMLGRGQFSVGYTFDDKDHGECVLKYFPNPFDAQEVKDAWKYECDALQALASADCPNVSRLARVVPFPAVLLKPRGLQFTSDAQPSAEDIIALVAAVKGVHDAGLCHGDITIGNIFRREGAPAFLNDFSHSRMLPRCQQEAQIQRHDDLQRLIQALAHHLTLTASTSFHLNVARGAATSLDYDAVGKGVIAAFQAAVPNPKRDRDGASLEMTGARS